MVTFSFAPYKDYALVFIFIINRYKKIFLKETHTTFLRGGNKQKALQWSYLIVLQLIPL